MKEKLTKKAAFLGLLMFVFNVIILLALAFLMIELNQIGRAHV